MKNQLRKYDNMLEVLFLYSGTFEFLGNFAIIAFHFVRFTCFGHDLLRCYAQSSSGLWLPNSIDNNATYGTLTYTQTNSLIQNTNMILHEIHICVLCLEPESTASHQTNGSKMQTLKWLFMATRAKFRNFKCDPSIFFSFNWYSFRTNIHNTHI